MGIYLFEAQESGKKVSQAENEYRTGTVLLDYWYLAHEGIGNACWAVMDL